MGDDEVGKFGSEKQVENQMEIFFSPPSTTHFKICTLFFLGYGGRSPGRG